MISSSIGDAFNKTASLLFKPFSWKKWAKLILIAWLAGALSGGTNLNWMNSRRSDNAKNSPAALKNQNKNAPAKTGLPAGVNASQVKKLEEQHKKKYWFEHGLFNSARDASGKIPGWYMAAVVWPLLIFIVLLILALMVFFIWLSARFKFVWLHAVQTEEVLVRRPLRQYENQGDSLTSFYILATFLTIVYFAAILVPMGLQIFAVVRTGLDLLTHLGFLWGFFWPLISLLVFSVLVTVIFYSIITDFIVPLMASGSLLFKEAFRKWLLIYQKNRGAVWRYFLTKFFASILAGAFSIAALVIVMIVSVIAGGIIFGGLYFLLFVFLKIKVLFWILAVILGVPFLVVVILAMMACSLPAAVFFRAFSLYFLSRLEAML